MRAIPILFLFALTIGCDAVPSEPGAPVEAFVEIVTVDESTGPMVVDAGVGWTVTACGFLDNGEEECWSMADEYTARDGSLCLYQADPCEVSPMPGVSITIATIIP